MWGIPGSHKKPTDYFMKRKPLEETTDEEGNVIISDQSKEVYYTKDKPEYSLEGAVPLDAPQGSIVLLHGDFVHFSYHNNSKAPRHAYTIHVVEGRETKWDKDNWLQRSPEKAFRLMYDVKA